MCEFCGERLVDTAINEGRIDASSREAFVRAYEASPDLVVEVLASTQPDTLRASRNYFAGTSPAEHDAWKADASARLGIPAAELV